METTASHARVGMVGPGEASFSLSGRKGPSKEVTLAESQELAACREGGRQVELVKVMSRDTADKTVSCFYHLSPQATLPHFHISGTSCTSLYKYFPIFIPFLCF